MVKLVKFLVRIISEHPQKAISLMFETDIFGACLVWKLAPHGPPASPLPPSGYAHVIITVCYNLSAL